LRDHLEYFAAAVVTDGFVMVIPLLGFGVGFLIGLTSMGGAALMAPLLILLVGVRPVVAVGTDLAYGAITKIVGAWLHLRQGTVDIEIGWRLACGSVPAGLVGVVIISLLRRWGLDPDQVVQPAIGVVLVIVALILFWRNVTESSSAPADPRLSLLRGRGTVAWGAFVGLAVGLTSVGSGSLVAPFLLLVFGLSPSWIVGTDVFHAAILLTATGLAHAYTQSVDWNLALMLLAGSIPGVLLGSFLAPKLPPKTLRIGLACLLFASGARLV
jgi:uncharacterized membrane protein YfcA